MAKNRGVLREKKKKKKGRTMRGSKRKQYKVGEFHSGRESMRLSPNRAGCWNPAGKHDCLCGH